MNPIQSRFFVLSLRFYFRGVRLSGGAKNCWGVTTFWLIFHKHQSFAFSAFIAKTIFPSFHATITSSKLYNQNRDNQVRGHFQFFKPNIYSSESKSVLHCSSLSSQAWIIRPDQFFVKPVPKPRNRKITAAAAEAKGEIHVPLCSSVQFHIVWRLTLKKSHLTKLWVKIWYNKF